MPRKQKISGPVAHVAGNDVQITQYVFNEAEPPDDPELSVQCPQCQRLTWRYTRHCVHCRLDVVAWQRRALLLRQLPTLKLLGALLLGLMLGLLQRGLP